MAITVVNLNGEESTWSGVFKEEALAGAALTATGVTPSVGPISGGTLVTIRGTGFQRGATVKFGSTPADSVMYVDETMLRVMTPARGAGTVAMAVNNPDGGSAVVDRAFSFVREEGEVGVSLTKTTVLSSLFRPGQDREIGFESLPSGTRVRVYSLRGELVAEFSKQ